MKELVMILAVSAFIVLLASIWFVYQQEWIPGIYLVLFAQYLRHESVLASMFADEVEEEEL